MVKNNNLALGIMITISIFLMIIFSFMLYKIYDKKELKETTYYHDVYQFDQITKEDVNNYYTRLDINNVINELGISSVISFFNQYTNNSLISASIIQEAIENKIPVNIAFSLAWKESKFNSQSINQANRNGSADWGLFQLNDKYYKWTRNDFFNIEKNVAAGVAHLEYCYNEMNDIQMALAAYNVGVTGVKTNGIPKNTEMYIIEILEFEDKLNQDFNTWVKKL